MGRVGGSRERDCGGFGDGLDTADWDGDDRGSHSFGDRCAIDELRSSGGCEADERGCGGGDVARNVDSGDLGRSSDVEAGASARQGCVVERGKRLKSTSDASGTCGLTLLTLSSGTCTGLSVGGDSRCQACCRDNGGI